MTSLLELVHESPFTAYSYAYPHKTAYRPLDPPVPLAPLWAAEERDALFLYFHIPFCEMRCGFCNLFTTVDPRGERMRVYLDALARETRAVGEVLGPATFARMAIGGGTPTLLGAAGLATVLDLAAEVLGVDAASIPTSVETSPGTADPATLTLLRARGVERISIGVQSFDDVEVAAIGRAQRRSVVEQALDHIRAAGFPTLNIDLIYGLPDQTPARWIASLEAALRYTPEELYLYPLYVRPLTGLGRRGTHVDDSRLELYRIGRDLLRSAGYDQTSLRMFRRRDAAVASSAPIYCCQEDGMVGLGCGARSYTRSLHYSSDFAVGASGVRAIIDEYSQRDAASFASARYGFVLNDDEQRRRYVIQSLLQVDGLAFDAYHRRFGAAALDELPHLADLAEHGLAVLTPTHLRLTEAGIEVSDTVGPWLYSPPVRASMETFELR